MHIFEILKKDHDKMRELLATLLAFDEDDRVGRADLVEEIRCELVGHARAEEALLYNSLRVLSMGEDVVGHGYREHVEAELLLRGLQVAEKLGVGWKAAAEKLRDAIEHHIDEEERKIFDAAAGAFTLREAEELGELFRRLKASVEDEGFVQSSMSMLINQLPPRLAAKLRSSATA